MNNLMVNIDEARSYMKDFQEGKFVPSISFMFESQRGFTGIDNSHHEFIVRTFESEGDCISWLESTSDRLTEKLSVDLPPLREWMTIKNLQDADLISGNTKYHAGIRNQLYKGENLNAKLVKTVYNPNIDAMTFIFKTPATIKAHEPGYQPLIVDPHANFIKKSNPSHNYTMMIQVLDFVKWLRETRPSNITTPITWKEIKDVLDVAYVKVWCNCLRGTTLIKLLDGRTVSVKDLAEEFKTNKDLWVYSTDEHGNFKPGKINDVAITGTATEFVRVTLDNGKQIETTEDHLYMMRDGSYKAVCELQVGESLMALNDTTTSTHKIAKIEYITVEEEPLYDISVDNWNNFYVDAGVVLHNCSSFHWFGKNYRATQFDCSLYPTNIPDKQMRGRFGEYDILCKHLGNLMKNQSIQFFLPQMASAAQKILKSRNLV